VQTRRQQISIKQMCATPTQTINVRRDGGFVLIGHEEVVPGDVVALDAATCERQTIKFDAVLLSGNCVMDESMLTGECVPVTKTSLPTTSGYSGMGRMWVTHFTRVGWT
jgi:cation-transporting ATPase 13A3/4/5